MNTLEVSTAQLEKTLMAARHSGNETHEGGEKRRIAQASFFCQKQTRLLFADAYILYREEGDFSMELGVYHYEPSR
jgi:hypothetical protein